MSQAHPPRQREFSWVRALVVPGILGVIVLLFAGVLACGIVRVREAAARSQSQNNLRQIGMATQNCNDAFMEVPMVSGRWKALRNDTTERSIFFNILPYIESSPFYRDLVNNAPGATTHSLYKTYVCPGDPTGDGEQGECSYAANWQVFQQPASTPQEYASLPGSLPDGVGHVILYAQIYQDCNGTVRRWGQTGPVDDYRTPAFNRMVEPDPKVLNDSNTGFQLKPQSSECSPPLAQSAFGGGMLVGLGDGTVRAISPNLSVTTWQRACAPADGQRLDSDW